MPSVRYYNQTAPFWDFVASLEEQGSTRHPEEGSDNEQENEHRNSWSNGWAGFPWGPFPHRGRHGPPPPPPPPPPHPHHGPPPHHEGPPPPPPPHEDEDAPEAGPSDPRGPPPPFPSSPEEGRRPGRHGHHGPGPRRGPCGRGGRAWARGGRGHFHPYTGIGGPFSAWTNMFQEHLNPFAENNPDNKNQDHKPDADVFDTPEAFVVHISLPGAKKEDISVNWDAEKSELSITGVTYRPGDEEFLKTLALDERKVGAFERKLRLGSRANPAQVDVDGITARLEDGILRIEVPKLDSGYVEIRKVDVE
ncbi:uncharacterized protein MYCFIDRAFT_210223 [Pseudocercospora fijiensis CIRAD86]|uniref:SHSP domain-containing protein n=1 Tax=Pseudocercospora fijiensis (strain CIRAD86) TaxID=383855 RepID=M3ALD8_PSEFD|nr:uncharacterized protein MYCFIDRAFT_210223 [Pseudocercospora fijiensis CIRAD86]EME85401.1 hypothetical protein MYCFIDRAFT_210223 [Pseudocercospora fijiensis CIRAD86]